jgi:hypothetical protein
MGFHGTSFLRMGSRKDFDEFPIGLREFKLFQFFGLYPTTIGAFQRLGQPGDDLAKPKVKVNFHLRVGMLQFLEFFQGFYQNADFLLAFTNQAGLDRLSRLDFSPGKLPTMAEMGGFEPSGDEKFSLG